MTEWGITDAEWTRIQRKTAGIEQDELPTDNTPGVTMRTDAKCPGCKAAMSPADVLCRSCMTKLPASYRADMMRAWKVYARTTRADDRLQYEETCRVAAAKVIEILAAPPKRKKK